MDKIERKLLNLIQGTFPIHPEPYRILGESIGVSEEEVLAKVQHLYDLGVIRRLGGVFDSRRLGYFSTLCTAKVPEDKVSLVAGLLAKIPGVTHNYVRNHAYNIWFTLIAISREQAENTLKGIREAAGIEVFSLPATKVFKIRVDFDMSQEKWLEKETEEDIEGDIEEDIEEDVEIEEKVQAGSFGVNPQLGKTPERGWQDEDRPLIRVLQKDLPHERAPFAALARQIDWSEEKVIKRTEALVRSAVIRRFGAVLRHQKAGFVANAMGVWQVEEAKVLKVGEKMASFREVSHCYQRPTLSDWPYNLFTMIHGHTPENCQTIMEKIAGETGVTRYAMLFSQAELKKSSMEYFAEEE